MTPSRSSDAVVVGGGVVGLSTAFHLAREGMRVTVLDRDSPPDGLGASGRTFGLVWASTKGPEHYLRLTLDSIGYYPEFLDLLGDDCGYRQAGGLVLADREAELSRLREVVAWQSRVFDIRLLDAAELRVMEPALSSRIAGATFSTVNGDIDARRLVSALRRACGTVGATVIPDAAVIRIRKEDREWQVATKDATYVASKVVDCAGPWAGEIAAMMGASIPLAVARGQLVVSRPLPKLLNHPTLDVRQANDGRVWMGTVYQPDRREFTPSPSDTEQIMTRAAHVLPALEGEREESVTVGLRPIPGDGHPLMGKLPGAGSDSESYLAVTHSGITLAPQIGKLMAGLIAHGTTAAGMVRFSPARFSTTAHHG